MQQEMNTTQIGVRLGISKRTVQRWIRSGKLKAKEIAHHRYLIEENDLEALIFPRPDATQQSETMTLREEFYDLAHQVSELERILEQIVESLTAIPEQIGQARLTVPLQMEETPPGSSQAEARIAALEQRVSDLERIIEDSANAQKLANLTRPPKAL